MSNNNAENEVDIIDSESVESNQEETLIKTQIIKKGSFLSFMAFIVAIAALALSIYQYIESQKKVSSTDTIEQPWMMAIQKIESQFNDKISHHSQANQKLNSSIKTLETKIAEINDKIQKDKIQKDKATEDGTNQETHDDSIINNNLAQLQADIKKHNQLIDQFSSQLITVKKEANQAIGQLSKKIESQNSIPKSQNSNIDHTDEIIDSLLHSAYIQLNINGNLKKGKTILRQALSKLNILESTDQKYQVFNKELIALNDKLAQVISPNVLQLTNEIKTLKMESEKLITPDPETVEQNPKELSWYEKLVVVRKIEDDDKGRLSLDETHLISQQLNNHYQKLNLALLNKNQMQWQQEIDQLLLLLSTHFNTGSDVIKAKLTELKSIQLNPILPDLQPFIVKFRQIGEV